MIKNHLIPYGHQWIDDDDIREVVKVLKSDWITQGPRVEEFEKAVAKYCGVKYGVAMSSGTSALHAAYAVTKIGPGDEVITTPLTFAATANAVVYCGGKPVFVDIQEDTLNIDPKEIEKRITTKTKVIAPVDFAGHPCDLDEIKNIAKKNKLLVIEDAAHALGSEYKRGKIGNLADMTIFSFHPVKAITAGEGGMILTNNKNFYEKLKVFRHHGIVKKPEKGEWYYEIENPGYNYRLTDIQCALGISQLKKLDKFIQRRREIVETYKNAFRNNDFFDLPVEKRYTKSSWHLYPIKLKDKYKNKKREIFTKLREKGLGVQVHYIPVYWQPYYQQLGYKKGICPNAEDFYQREISIPLYQSMSDEDTKYVISTILEVFKKFR